MSYQSPAERHASVVGELVRRRMCETQRMADTFALPEEQDVRDMLMQRSHELSALLEVASLHAPDTCAWPGPWCLACEHKWPDECLTFLVIERAVAENPGHPQPEGGQFKP